MRKLDCITIRRGKLFSKWIGTEKRILDLGIGDIYTFYSNGNKTISFDINPNNKYLVHNGVIGDFERELPFKNNSFDVVVAGEIIEHIRKPNLLCKEIKRVLKPKGLFIGSTPNSLNWKRRLGIIFGFILERYINEYDHIIYFNKKTLKMLLLRHFRGVEIRGLSVDFWKNLLATLLAWRCQK